MIDQLGLSSSRALDPLPPTLDLDACYRYCEALCRARRQIYPVASMFARSHLRKHIFALFAFARVADDFADEPAYEGRRARELDRWEEQLHLAYRRHAEHPVFVALAATVDKFSLPITEFTELLSGFRTDLECRRYATFEELRSYTRQAAEPVGRLLLYIDDYRAPEAHAFVEDLSSALAIARLVQNMAADWDRGRVYMPVEDLRHFGVTDVDIAERRTHEPVGRLVRYEVARTRALFMRARPLVDMVGADLAIELALMWHGGMRILDKIDATGRLLLQERPHLTTADSVLVLARALAWRGETLPRRAMDLALRAFDQHTPPPR